jgi:hypothetical protein
VAGQGAVGSVVVVLIDERGQQDLKLLDGGRLNGLSA